ncbi:MAG: glycosyltransferase [Hyphomicrobiaceae bacterium]
MTKPRVLLYVQHLLGVGHVARAAALARGMTAAGIDVTVVTGGEPVPAIGFGAAEVVQLPWLRAADTSFKTLLDAEGRPATDALFAGRRHILLSLAERVAPDAILIEHYPFGRRKFRVEIDPLLDAWQGRACIACSVRDVLVEKGDTKKAAAAVALINARFDRVFVHGDGAVLPLDRTFPLAREIADKIVYTGYVVDRRTDPPHWVKTTDGHDEVIVSVGGGAVGLDLLKAAIGAKRLGAAPNHVWRLLAGANLAEADVAELKRLAPPGLIVEPARPDFRTLLTRAALSISQAGYNTVMDVLEAGCRNVVVPFAAGSESEQLFRARELEARGLLTVLDEAKLSPQSLANAVDTALAAPKPAAARIDLTGIETTARLILAMLEGKRG